MRLGLNTTTAAVAVVLMVAIAIGLGATAGIVSRPSPSPTPSPTPAPSPTAEPDTAPLVFQQPLSSGCASSNAIWVVSNGGGIGRFDGQRWQMVDTTLRSLVDAACGPDAVIAVGPAGRVLTVDERARTIRADDLGINDYYGVSMLPDGALVVGSQGAVQRQSFSGWQPYAQGIDEDLFAVTGFSGSSAWAVGAGGVAYRLDEKGWLQFPTGTQAVLRTVSGPSPTDVIAAGDSGVLLRFDGRWRPLTSGVTTALRASVRAGSVTYVAGDGGVALAIDGASVTRVDLGTTCALRGVFARGDEVWFVGSDGLRAGVWRRSGDRVEKWGTC